MIWVVNRALSTWPRRWQRGCESQPPTWDLGLNFVSVVKAKSKAGDTRDCIPCLKYFHWSPYTFL